MRTVPALFVDARGVYAGREAVELWDVERDARRYRGPHPVVAHPPCERWGRYWSGGPSAKVKRKLGDDGGCFEAALEAVRTFGGVLEHPEASRAWHVYALPRPQRAGGWQRGLCGGWSCYIEQGGYGHQARKGTWLYAFGADELPRLRWGRAPGDFVRLDHGYHDAGERQAAPARPSRDRTQIARTPVELAGILVDLARRCSA